VRLVLLVALVACGGARGRPDYPTPEDDEAAGPRRARAAEPGTPPAAETRGEVTRAALDEMVAAGPGALLARVRVQAARDKAAFKGWQLLSLPPQPWLRPGDVLLRVNGRALERPEDLSRVFEAMRGATEIVLDYERDGAPAALRIPIVEE
jgi:type II secretory pathway component PulC